MLYRNYIKEENWYQLSVWYIEFEKSWCLEVWKDDVFNLLTYY